jgi:hypothetical protein
LSKLSASEKNDDRKRRESNNDDSAIPAETTMAITTTEKTLTPFQAQRVLLIGKLRELVINGYSPLAIQAELGISQRQYYRLRQKAFEHDCQLIEQWDSDTFREDLAIYMARLQKILAFLMDKMQDPNAHDIIRVKAAQLATELSNAIYQSSSEGVFHVKRQAERDMDQWALRVPLHCYLQQNKITCHTLAQYKEAQRQLDKEEKGKNKTSPYNLSANADS